MSGQEHTTECRKRLEDAMTTDTSTAARAKATRVRQAERIVKDLDESGSTNPSGSSGPSGSGQHKRVRFSDQEPVESRPERDAEMRTGRSPVTRKRSAETDAERLEEEVTSAEADSGRRLALKRKSEGDPHDIEVENTVMDSLVESLRENNDPDDEIDLLICQQRDQYVASVHETGTDRKVCEVPKTPFPYDECGWDYIDDPSGKLLNNTLVDKARTEEIWVIRELGCLGVVDSPVARSCLAHDGSTSTRVIRTSPSTAVGWSCRNTNVKPTGHFLSGPLKQRCPAESVCRASFGSVHR